MRGVVGTEGNLNNSGASEEASGKFDKCFSEGTELDGEMDSGVEKEEIDDVLELRGESERSGKWTTSVPSDRVEAEKRDSVVQESVSSIVLSGQVVSMELIEIPGPIEQQLSIHTERSGVTRGSAYRYILLIWHWQTPESMSPATD